METGGDGEEGLCAVDVDAFEERFGGERVGGGGVDYDCGVDSLEDGEEGGGGGDVGFVVGGAREGVVRAFEVDNVDGGVGVGGVAGAEGGEG